MRLVYRYALVLLSTIAITFPCIFLIKSVHKKGIYENFQQSSYTNHVIGSLGYSTTNPKCRFYSCFNVFHCRPNNEWQIKVFVYPKTYYHTVNNKAIFPEESYEYECIINAIQRSKYHTNNISEACLFIPPVDLLSEKGLDLNLVSAVLYSLPRWQNGSNHLLFNFFPLLPLPVSKSLHFQIGNAMVASSNLCTSNNRQGFDVSIPLFNSLTVLDSETHIISISATRKWKLIISQLSIDKDQRNALRKVEDSESGVLMLRKCLGTPENTIHHDKLCKDGLPFAYPDILKDGTFCLLLPGHYYGTTLLLDAIMMGCIPVIMMDNYLLPFHDIIDWKRASVRLQEYQIHHIHKMLEKIDQDEIRNRRHQAFYLWREYFSSIDKIVETALDIFNERVFINKKKSYEEWNRPFGNIQGNLLLKPVIAPPLFLPLRPSLQTGFTAVILTYNRVDMLFILIKALEKVPSLAKIIIVWNNPYSNPHTNMWPVLYKPWKLIQTKTNRLTNRFYPFQEIETEAVMAIDDDILMLTTDEIEFAYQTWREFPDRLVGFPARAHITDPNELINGKRMKYKYESEWQNELSMVLTGAAFYHKMYNHLFTYMLPLETKDYIDKKMNCEDIGMNFLISNLTGKAPIKVSPRKRFKCAQCRGNDSLWSETSHFIKRSECLTVFTDHFGRMPLEPVEFRVDPVLFQEAVPQQMKAFPDVGMV